MILGSIVKIERAVPFLPFRETQQIDAVSLPHSCYTERHKPLRIHTQRLACLTRYDGFKINHSKGESAIYDDAVYNNIATASFGEKLGVSRQTVNELLLERRAVSPAMALRLSRLFGNTPEFWLNAQRAVDLWNAKRENQ